MKEIKAYVRRSAVARVVEELQTAGAPGITVVEIHPVGYGFEPSYFSLRPGDPLKRYGHLEIVKVEVVCADTDLDRMLHVIYEAAHTGAQGDGIIFVSEVLKAVRIRDGVSGEEAL